MSYKALSDAWEATLPNAAQKLVLISLADQSNDDGRCWPSIESLKKRTGLCERSVQTHITDLEKSGHITRDFRSGRSTVYAVHPVATPAAHCTPAKPAPPQCAAPLPPQPTAPAPAAGCTPPPQPAAPRTISEPTRNHQEHKTTVALKRNESVDLVFDHWKLTMNHGHARLDAKRTKQITAALSLGYSVEDLCNAITGCSLSQFHMGDNDRGQKYDGLELILRDAGKVDQFLGFYDNPPCKPAATVQKLTGQTQHDRNANFMSALLSPLSERDVTPQPLRLGRT